MVLIALIAAVGVLVSIGGAVADYVIDPALDAFGVYDDFGI